MTLNASNSKNLEQLVLKGLNAMDIIYRLKLVTVGEQGTSLRSTTCVLLEENHIKRASLVEL